MSDKVKEVTLYRQIESCLVTKNLISQLEECLFKEIPGFEKFRENNIRENYSLAIKQEARTDKVENIQNYTNSRFNDSTNQILLEVTIKRPKTLIISINFVKDKKNSIISVKHRSQKPDVLVNGISATIKEIIHTSANYNKIFHPHKFVGLLLHLIGIISFAFTTCVIFFVYSAYMLKVVAASVSLLYVFFIFGKVLKPYIIFDSNRSRKRKKIYDFIFWGLLNSIIFGTFFSLFKKSIFGI